jgi:hypothetical protein
MFNNIVGAASRYGSGSDQMMRLLAALAPQHSFFCIKIFLYRFTLGSFSHQKRIRFFAKWSETNTFFLAISLPFFASVSLLFASNENSGTP